MWNQGQVPQMNSFSRPPPRPATDSSYFLRLIAGTVGQISLAFLFIAAEPLLVFLIRLLEAGSRWSRCWMQATSFGSLTALFACTGVERLPGCFGSSRVGV